MCVQSVCMCVHPRKEVFFNWLVADFWLCKTTTNWLHLFFIYHWSRGCIYISCLMPLPNMTSCYGNIIDSSHCYHCTVDSSIFSRWCQNASLSNTWFFGLTRVCCPNGILIGCPMWALGHNVPLIWFFILVLYIYSLLLYIVCFPSYPFFLHFFLISSVTYFLLWEQTRSVSSPNVAKGDWIWL